MQKKLTKDLWVVTLTCISVASAIGAHASVLGFSDPGIGQIVTGTTFDNGWTASLNGDTNSGAQVYWYGRPPKGPESQFEPDPAGINSTGKTLGGADPSYKGGAVWLDSGATIDNGHITTGPGVAISKTLSDSTGTALSLSFYVNTEVTPNPVKKNLDNLKGSPAGVFLFVNGQMISSGVGDGSFLSTGNTPNPKDPNTQADAVWTKYTVHFTGTGSDTITFEDDISAQGVADGETNVPFDSNSILADISLNSVPVPEVSPLTMVGVALVGAIGFTMFRPRKFAVS